MAEKRMISRVISVSEKVNLRLKDSFHMLLYTWMIPHSDDFGRLTGSPAKVRALIVPMMDKTIADVEFALKCLSEAELILWYEVKGDKYIEIINFEEHQSGLHKRTKSKIPDPIINEIPRSSEKFTDIPSELNRTEQNRTEEEGKGTECATESIPPFNDSIKNQIYELSTRSELKSLNIVSADELFFYIDKVDLDVLLLAIKKAYQKHMNYAVNTLRDWVAEGKTTLELINPSPKKSGPKSGTSGKPKFEIVSPKQEEVSDEEYQEALELARQIQGDP